MHSCVDKDRKCALIKCFLQRRQLVWPLKSKTNSAVCMKNSEERKSAVQNQIANAISEHITLSLILAASGIGQVWWNVVRHSAPLMRTDPNSQADILASPRITNTQSVALRLEGREWVGNQLRPNGESLNKGYPSYDFGGKREENGPKFQFKSLYWSQIHPTLSLPSALNNMHLIVSV